MPGLLFVGRLIERKNTHILVEAFSRLAGHYPDLTLTIAGDGPERPRLEGLVRRHGIGERVRFRGHLSGDALAGAYSESSILILPADTDAMPNVVLEAMAAGLAIVTTRNGAAEVVRGNGLLLERADPADVYQALCSYLDDPALLMEHQKISRILGRADVMGVNRRVFSGHLRRSAGGTRAHRGRSRARVSTARRLGYRPACKGSSTDSRPYCE